MKVRKTKKCEVKKPRGGEVEETSVNEEIQQR